MYGGIRARSFFRRHNRQLLNRIIAQEVLYYKLSLKESPSNIYGESLNKMYFNPVLLTCLVDMGEQTSEDEEYGKNTGRNSTFRFLKDDLEDIILVPEMGDIVCWQEGYYEISLVIENQRVMGKTPEYSLENDLQKYGESWSILCVAHLTSLNKLNIIKNR